MDEAPGTTRDPISAAFNWRATNPDPDPNPNPKPNPNPNLNPNPNPNPTPNQARAAHAARRHGGDPQAGCRGAGA